MENRKCLFGVGVLLLLHASKCQGVVAKEEEEKEGIIDLVGSAVDVFNVFTFVVAGGPDEVLPRLVFLGITVFVVASLAAICGCFFEGKERYTSLEWGCRGISSYFTLSELVENSGEWGF